MLTEVFIPIPTVEHDSPPGAIKLKVKSQWHLILSNAVKKVRNL